MEQTIKIKVIVGSTRQNRFSEKPAYWIYNEVKKEEGVEAELLDLRDYAMPFFNEPVSPAMSGGKYANEVVQKWAEKIKEGDAFIIVTPEYNHGYPAVLKNALDSIFQEWNRKAVGFVSYGGAGGTRSVEQLRQVVIELQMTPIRNAIHIPMEIYLAVMKEQVPVNPELFKPLRKGMMGDRVEAFLNELIWTSMALKTGGEKEKKTEQT
ncbi:NAD(P)H-dependent oxidoreductase [Candidatus Woesearchaeota archaeon]|nr:NAD(P)H-dependent oxidoreductase [Candidatus Woesearchaeota archaeon]